MAVGKKIVSLVDKTTGYRTYVAAALVAVFGVLQGVDWNNFFSEPKAGSVAIFTAILFAILRTFTTTPPLQGKPPEDTESK